MRLLAIDPGPVRSAYVLYDADDKQVVRHGIEPNEDVRSQLRAADRCGQNVVIEMVASYGKPVGEDVFETCVEIGRMLEAGQAAVPARMKRADVKMALCHQTAGITDSVIRQRLIDLFGPGKEAAIGTKNHRGPLYGVKKDEWQALGLAVAFSMKSDTFNERGT